MKYLYIPMSVLLVSLSGHNASANVDNSDDIDAKAFTKKLRRDITHYDFEISIFSEDGVSFAPKILEKIGDQDVAGALRELKSPRGKKQFSRQYSEDTGQKPHVLRSKKTVNFFKKMKVKFFYDLAKAKSYKAQKDCFKFVLRLQGDAAK